MRILIVSATRMEVKLLADEMHFIKEKQPFLESYRFSGNEIDILITGIGTTATTFKLTNALNMTKYHFVLNTGIAGSLNHKLRIGEVVNVVTEEFADLGVEKKEKFLTLFESGFVDENEFPYQDCLLKASCSKYLDNIKKVHGITANKSHSNIKSIDELKKKFKADVETMEGAAVFYVSISLGIPCCQIRAISNYVKPAENANWDIPTALENLQIKTISVLNNINLPQN